MKRLAQCLPLCFFSMVTSITLFSGCSDDVSTVGSALFPNNVHVDSLFLYADSSATYRTAITGNSETLLLGRYQDTEARLLLQFSIPFGIADTNILSAEVRFIPRYWFKDSTGTLEFTVRKILQNWNEFTVKFGTTDSSFFDPKLYGTFSLSLSPADTIPDMMIAALDTALIREWVRTPASNNGIILVPTVASTVVYGFTSSPSLPELSLRYIVSDSTRRIDTTIVQILQDAFVANAPQPDTSSQLIVVQAGIADRGLLHFDVRGIPRGASIIRADLTVVRDMALSVKNIFSFDSLVVQLPRGGFVVLAKPPSEDSSVFNANISILAQQWVTGKLNSEITLRAYGESNTLDRFAFYGAAADTLNRPRLHIVYSELRK